HFFYSVLLGGVLPLAMRGRRVRLITAVAGVLAGCVLAGWQTVTIAGENPVRERFRATLTADPPVTRNYMQSETELLEWISINTGEADTFAGWIGTTPGIFAYSDRPI